MGKLVFRSCGFVVQNSKRDIYDDYCGIEGDNWCLCFNNELENRDLNTYCNKNITRNWKDSRYTDLCYDIDYLIKYTNACKSAGLEIRVYFCMTTKRMPECSNGKFLLTNEMTFLGFDYAYAGGSFYSSVFSDIYTKRILEFEDIPLNKFGLINTEKDMLELIRVRNKLIKNNQYNLEVGDFAVFKIWDCGKVLIEGNATDKAVVGKRGVV